MKGNSIIEMKTVYQTPCVVEIAFKFGGPLCQSKEVETGGNNGGYGSGNGEGWGDDAWD